jgi:hypothetical protein
MIELVDLVIISLFTLDEVVFDQYSKLVLDRLYCKLSLLHKLRKCERACFRNQRDKRGQVTSKLLSHKMHT